ncbi:thioredoxin-like protein [Apiosordaria backusii]|uniref:Thioredoxin-like protein n=1 Tax=Apiosordaria backusii TaxID=314023 RepID=A0AA40ENC6_9PEZI|nr:thioredoxin-like protein [Apiosordaria backusii]
MFTNTTSPNPFVFNIDIYTDTVCPFSYLGFLSLTRAISSFSSSSPFTPTTPIPTPIFNLTYHPYILYPTARPSSRALGTALKYIYSSSSSSHSSQTKTSILTHLDNLAEGYNIIFNWEGLTGNSRDSHRLVLLSQLRWQNHHHNHHNHHNHQTFMTALYRANFELGQDISNRTTLSNLGVDTGLFTSEQDGLAWLESDALGPEVDAESQKARTEIGVRAVPSYVVNNKWVVGGMQDRAMWEGLFSKILKLQSVSVTGTVGGEKEEVGAGEGGGGGAGGGACHGRNCRFVVDNNG